MLLGCIGDDFTGSSDLANTLAKQGMRTVQYTGVPSYSANPEVEAGVVALKSRSIPASLAVEQSLAALAWLQAQGCQQIFFKYCSTFDSTDDGNIGPVCDALASALQATRVIVCPAFPGTGRSIYQGHLFVNDKLLNESGMQDHPLTPMQDPDLRRCLARQSQLSVGHVPYVDVAQGADKIKQSLIVQEQNSHRLIVIDAITDQDLLSIGEAAQNEPLITGGSGVALGLPKNFEKAGKITGKQQAWEGENGKCVVLSGSCSTATRQQIEYHLQTNPGYKIDAEECIKGKLDIQQLWQWVNSAEGIPIVYSSASPADVSAIQAKYGLEKSSKAMESLFSALAQLLVRQGVRRIITAGGETSGAVVTGLQLDQLSIGPEIDPGVPALRAGKALVLALKSGNFGSEDFFVKAALQLQ